MRLTIITLAALAALPFTATTVHADDVAPVCSSGYVAAGPYCVNPIYVNNPLFVDPATCVGGYYQGSCVVPTVVDTPESSAAVGLASPAAGCNPATTGCTPPCNPATTTCVCNPAIGCGTTANVARPVGFTSDELRLALMRGPR